MATSPRSWGCGRLLRTETAASSSWADGWPTPDRPHRIPVADFVMAEQTSDVQGSISSWIQGLGANRSGKKMPRGAMENFFQPSFFVRNTRVSPAPTSTQDSALSLVPVPTMRNGNVWCPGETESSRCWSAQSLPLGLASMNTVRARTRSCIASRRMTRIVAPSSSDAGVSMASEYGSGGYDVAHNPVDAATLRCASRRGGSGSRSLGDRGRPRGRTGPSPRRPCRGSSGRRGTPRPRRRGGS